MRIGTSISRALTCAASRVKATTIDCACAAGPQAPFFQPCLQARQDGKPTATEFTANYDGKDNPFKGSPVVDTASLRRIDANTIDRTDKKAGKVVQTIKREIAKDGKSFIATVKGTNAKGEPVNNVLLFEKQ